MAHFVKIEILRKLPGCNRLKDEELALLSQKVQEVRLKKGSYLFKEGDRGEELFIIAEGKIALFKKDVRTEEEKHLADLTEGDIFGEMALLNDLRRTTSAFASTDTTLLKISLKELAKSSKTAQIAAQIQKELPEMLMERMKSGNIATAAAMQKQLEHEQARSHLGNLLVYLLVLIFLYIYALRIITLLKVQVISSTVISIPVLSLFGLSMLVLMKKSGYPWSTYGFTTKRWAKDLLFSLLWTAPLLAFTAFLKWAFIELYPGYSHLSVISLSGALNHKANAPFLSLVLIGAYLVFVPVQEIIYRGALQTTLEKLLLTKRNILVSILISNLPFSLIHLHLSFILTIVVYFYGLFWGWMYAKQKSLVGCTVSHLLTGFFAFFVISIQEILIA